ncbi:MAG: 1,4-dihydroxy-2-naphthoate octaprenyltransferase [Bacteroidetes bacterium]|nr:MAG: 1,4-dihydroxy-2-naphthoate octaprenyltransferase [Bacteroidota bacterium]
MKVWLEAFRLRTLPLSLSGIVVGVAAAGMNGFWDGKVIGLALLTTVLFQIVSNLANDLGDGLKGTDNDERVGPTRTIQSGKISVKQMKIAVLLGSLLSLLSASFLIYFGGKSLPANISLFYIFLAVSCVLAALLYTLGKKAYGYLGLGDFFVFIFFGLVSVLGVYPLLTKQLDLKLMPAAVAIGLLSVAVLNLNNMRDRVNDEQSGKKTLVVRIGGMQAKRYHTALIISALGSWSLFSMWNFFPAILLSLLPFALLFIHLMKVWKIKEERLYDPHLKLVALSTFAIAVLYLLSLSLK